MFQLGIDVSKKTLDLCLLRDVKVRQAFVWLTERISPGPPPGVANRKRLFEPPARGKLGASDVVDVEDEIENAPFAVAISFTWNTLCPAW